MGHQILSYQEPTLPDVLPTYNGTLLGRKVRATVYDHNGLAAIRFTGSIELDMVPRDEDQEPKSRTVRVGADQGGIEYLEITNRGPDAWVLGNFAVEQEYNHRVIDILRATSAVTMEFIDR